MRLYEHEAKRLLSGVGLPVPVSYGVWDGVPVLSAAAFPVMVKAQVLSGKRGKSGGVVRASSAEEASAAVSAMLGTIVGGHEVREVLLEEAVEHSSEMYVGITTSPSTGNCVLMVSRSGGIDVEEASAASPGSVLRLEVADASDSLPDDMAMGASAFLGGDAVLAGLLKSMYALYQERDMRTLEVNPLVATPSGYVCLDAKAELDDNGLYRNRSFLEGLSIGTGRHDSGVMTPREVGASGAGIPYVDLLPAGAVREEGRVYVGLVPGGAGYGMLAIDEVVNAGMELGIDAVPLNFMDSGGGPTRQKVAGMFSMVMDHPLVDMVVTSRFGGVSSCDTYVRGLVDCMRERASSGRRVVPVYGRMVGTDLSSAREYLEGARRDTPGPLSGLRLRVGNGMTMFEVVKSALSSFSGGEFGEPAVGVSGPVGSGMLGHLVRGVSPGAAGCSKVAIIGLGTQGRRHARLMMDYGTDMVAGVDRGGRGMPFPVYGSVAEMVASHPGIAAVSIWKHHSSAPGYAIEAIEAGIPIVVLITEYLPARDTRRILDAARRKGTLLFGPNTPGLVFPPEKVKIGMLPDIFQPSDGTLAPPECGVSICSRSGSILYHVSDALASVGIAQNAVVGVGGDSAVGTPFSRIVPLLSGYSHTDMVVVAGEIGGTMEEDLASDIVANPSMYPKPVVAMLSGRLSPKGKTMGHAGAIVSPGTERGTYLSKRKALEDAGVRVVNSQGELVKTVREVLGIGRTYFVPGEYVGRMSRAWEAPPPVRRWATSITKVVPNELTVRGKPLGDIIGSMSLVGAACLLATGEVPGQEAEGRLQEVAVEAALAPACLNDYSGGDDIGGFFARSLMADRGRACHGDVERVAYYLGRAVRYATVVVGSRVVNNYASVKDDDLADLLAKAVLPDLPGMFQSVPRQTSRLVEAMAVACVDHGVTPPSTQAAMLAASVRCGLNDAIASGVVNITDVHGGAGAEAARFFLRCVHRADHGDLFKAAAVEVRKCLDAGGRVEGMGHRIHTRDPRRDVLFRLARENGVDGPCMRLALGMEDLLMAEKGISLPLNVDGAIGAIVADMGLRPEVAKVLFIVGRIAGLAAHYFEEVSTFPPMRNIDFGLVEYVGA